MLFRNRQQTENIHVGVKKNTPSLSPLSQPDKLKAKSIKAEQVCDISGVKILKAYFLVHKSGVSFIVLFTKQEVA